MSEAQKKVNAQKARVARAMEPHYKTFGVLKKPGAGQSNDLKTKIYDSWMRWIEGQEQGDLTTEDVNAEVSKIADNLHVLPEGNSHANPEHLPCEVQAGRLAVG